ncbi:MAG: YopX family protein [Oscillospiraceae bacterium]|nr:YopX family protein [Oscillospiraceae bacterium]
MPTNNTRGLWRGKCVDNNNKWVECDLSRINSVDNYFIEDIQSKWLWRVDTETLGECTGLHDKNGTLIFEGDIVEINHPYNGMSIHKVVLDDFCWNLEGFYASCFDYPSLAFSEGTEYMTVIGNIHDNPELLKGVEDNGSRS